MPPLPPRRFILALLLIAMAAGPAAAAGLQPLGIEDAALLRQDDGEFRAGLAYSSGLHLPFQGVDRTRRVWEAPTLRLAVGLGSRVEGQLLYNWMRVQETGQDTTWGSGDLLVAFKIRLLPPNDSGSAMALRFATKFPNADEKKDFGTDEADIFTELLLSKDLGPMALHLNLGLAILGDPGETTDGQDDLLKYAFGLRIPMGDSQGAFLLSAEGLDLGERTNKRGALLAGIQIPAGKWLWDIGGSLGYARNSEEWSVRSGLTLPFTLPDGS
ncbi:hypothetical protein DSOUD_3204 [Desulfuromonas soudanensis]|uniref:Transporter n=1 Tax=Desulfuromonas soudanensis TaxID=1603606 RepID=A0A0M4D3C1_9BACT|nr:hypothetical protein [Desulfuromonas soudanensis]ALC17927.1 hypothetical protein DSOUD_3204 [Desulfuromonas soudanensis]